MTTPPLEVANTARASANRARATALLDVAGGRRTVAEVVELAAADSGRPLLRLSLRQLLLAQPGWGVERTRQVIGKVTSVVDADAEPDRITLAWVLDARAAGRRFMALCDALTVNPKPPWPGFPFSPRPTQQTHTRSER